jgi:low temperature requirement protein LtrA
VLSAGFVSVGYEYVLWTAALAVQALSPLIIHPRGRFSIQPAHFVERHGALMIVAFGESVAGVGIGAAGQPVTVSLALSAALGLALAAALWWAFFGTGDDDRAEAAMTSADPSLRPQLALSAYFYAYIPMLLGIVAVAAGLKHAIGHPEMTLTTGSAFALSAGVTLFMAGDGIFRRVLRIGSPWFRAGASAVALAAWPVAAAVGAAAGIALLTVVVAVTLAAERRAVQVTVKA